MMPDRVVTVVEWAATARRRARGPGPHAGPRAAPHVIRPPGGGAAPGRGGWRPEGPAGVGVALGSYGLLGIHDGGLPGADWAMWVRN